MLRQSNYSDLSLGIHCNYSQTNNTMVSLFVDCKLLTQSCELKTDTAGGSGPILDRLPIRPYKTNPRSASESWKRVRPRHYSFCIRTRYWGKLSLPALTSLKNVLGLQNPKKTRTRTSWKTGTVVFISRTTLIWQVLENSKRNSSKKVGTKNTE